MITEQTDMFLNRILNIGNVGLTDSSAYNHE